MNKIPFSSPAIKKQLNGLRMKTEVEMKLDFVIKFYFSPADFRMLLYGKHLNSCQDTLMRLACGKHLNFTLKDYAMSGSLAHQGRLIN